MKAFSSRQFARGFTLLELIVVIMLVSLITGLVMQGVLYVARQYSVVERQQQHITSREYLRGWLRFSVTGIINGFDGEMMPSRPFYGSSNGFSAISLSPLGDVNRGVPYLVEWRLRKENDNLLLEYAERAFNESINEIRWYTLRQWPGAEGRWLYFADDAWAAEYPISNMPLGFDIVAVDRQVVPDLIGLEITMPNDRFDQIVALKSDTYVYRPPSTND